MRNPKKNGWIQKTIYLPENLYKSAIKDHPKVKQGILKEREVLNITVRTSLFHLIENPDYINK